MKIIVASKNPVKIKAVQEAFEKVFTGKPFIIKTLSVPSGVREQPIGDEETFNGALQRVNNAKELAPDATFWIGIEGGVVTHNNEMMSFAWVVISSSHQIGKARTMTFQIPAKVAELIAEGYELGEADDMVFGEANSKLKNGAVGLLTDNIIDRRKLYQQTVILALIPHIKNDLFLNLDKLTDNRPI